VIADLVIGLALENFMSIVKPDDATYFSLFTIFHPP